VKAKEKKGKDGSKPHTGQEERFRGKNKTVDHPSTVPRAGRTFQNELGGGRRGSNAGVTGLQRRGRRTQKQIT